MQLKKIELLKKEIEQVLSENKAIEVKSINLKKVVLKQSIQFYGY